MNLLEYVRTPGKYQIKTTAAALRVQQTHGKLNTQTSAGRLEQRQQHPQVRMDTVQLRSSLGYKNMPDFMNDAAQRGSAAALRAIRDYAEFGNSIKNIQNGANIPDAMFSRQMQRAQGELVIVPLSPPNISFTQGGVETQFTPTEVQNTWTPGSVQLEFVPGSIDFKMVQYPEINFNFMGGFIYVPPSAAPDA